MNNTVNNYTAYNKKTTTYSSKPSTAPVKNTQEDKKLTKEAKIGLTLAGLAIATTAGILIHKNSKNSQKATKEVKDEIKETIEENGSWENIHTKTTELLNKLKKLPKEEWQKIDEKTRNKTEDLAQKIKSTQIYMAAKHEDDLIELATKFEAKKQGLKANTPNIILINGLEDKTTQNAVEELSKLADCKLEKISIDKDPNKILNDVSSKITKDDEHKFIYIENSDNLFESLKSSSRNFIMPAIENAKKHNKTIIIDPKNIDLEDSKDIDPILKSEIKVFQTTPFVITPAKKRIIESTQVKIGLKAQENGLLDLLEKQENDTYKKFLFGDLPYEKAGFDIVGENLIAILGEDKSLTSKAIDLLAEASDLPIERVKLDPENQREGMGKLYDITVKSAENYKKTNKRTLVIAENLEEIIGDEKNNRFINSLKSLTENCYEKSKMTIIFNSSKFNNIDSALKGRTNWTFPIKKEQ